MTDDQARAAAASAQVIVRSASGRSFSGDTAITAANVREYMPSKEDADAARAAFALAGFEVGPLVGISFAITAPARLFEEFFGVPLAIDARGNAVPQAGLAHDRLQLPFDRVPPDLASRLVAVTFTPPADLHEAGRRS